jgi:hypothetical protein
MRNGKIRWLLAGVLAVGLIAAGCGDDDNGDAGESSGITKAEWIAQVNEICGSGKNIEQQVADVEALQVPEGDEEEVDAILSAADQGLERIDQDPAAMDESLRLLSEYGVEGCG